MNSTKKEKRTGVGTGVAGGVEMSIFGSGENARCWGKRSKRENQEEPLYILRRRYNKKHSRGNIWEDIAILHNTLFVVYRFMLHKPDGRFH